MTGARYGVRPGPNNGQIGLSFSGHQLSCIRGERLVFQDLDFSVSPGSALLLRGPNGSGKSTLLRLAAGFLKAEQGSLSFALPDGSLETNPEAFREHIHYVGHLDPVKAAFTVTENLAFYASFDGTPQSVANIPQALERMGLGHLADIPGRYLSAGQRRRLNIARIAAVKKPLWLLDEPSVSLDDASVALLADLINDHCAAGGMVMAATHIDLGFESTATLELAPARSLAYIS